MKNFLSALIFIFAIHSFGLDLKPGENFAYELLDYKNAPVYKDIQKHREHVQNQIDSWLNSFLKNDLEYISNQKFEVVK